MGKELKICSRLRGTGLARPIPQPSYNHWAVWPRLTLFLGSPGASSLRQGNLPGCRVGRGLGCDVSVGGSGKVSQPGWRGLVGELCVSAFDGCEVMTVGSVNLWGLLGMSVVVAWARGLDDR
jgi:hypothetical protein